SRPNTIETINSISEKPRARDAPRAARSWRTGSGVVGKAVRIILCNSTRAGGHAIPAGCDDQAALVAVDRYRRQGATVLATVGLDRRGCGGFQLRDPLRQVAVRLPTCGVVATDTGRNGRAAIHVIAVAEVAVF